MTEFLTFNRSRIAFQDADCLKQRTKLGVELDQGAGNTQFGSFRLTLDAAACSVDLYIILVERLNGLQGQLDLILQVLQGEILLVILIVHRDLSLTLRKKHA